MTDLEAALLGCALALVLHVLAWRPLIARDDERHRRSLGYKPRRRLPEDN